LALLWLSLFSFTLSPLSASFCQWHPDVFSNHLQVKLLKMGLAVDRHSVLMSQGHISYVTSPLFTGLNTYICIWDYIGVMLYITGSDAISVYCGKNRLFLAN
jgi:hypothetical protein